MSRQGRSSIPRVLIALAFLLVVAAPDLWRAVREAGRRPPGMAIRWQPTLDAALVLAKRMRKPVFVEFGAVWCGPCRDMLDTTYRDPEVVAALNTRFVPVLVDVDHDRALAARFRVGAIPDAFFLTPDGRLMTRVVGYADAPAFLRAADDARRRLASGETGSSNRTPDASPPLLPPDFPLP